MSISNNACNVEVAATKGTVTVQRSVARLSTTDWTGSPHKRQEIEQAGADVLSIGRTITTDVKGSELH